jgi:3-oxoacyl-[acyl-carrier protein] reductase
VNIYNLDAVRIQLQSSTLLLFSTLSSSELKHPTQKSQFNTTQNPTMSSTKPLSGKVAIVTGGSRGIGRAICLKLANDGAKVVVNYSSSPAAAEEVVSSIGSSQSIAIKADVGNIDEISHLVDETVSKFGKIDILVACAGIMPLNELEKVTEEEFESVFNLNVKGPLFLAQVCCSLILI